MWNAFHPGFYAFRDYCLETNAEEYDGMILRGILDDFSHILQQHLAEEIETLLELSYCDGSQLKKAFGDFEASIIAGADSASLLCSLSLSPIVYKDNEP